MKHLTPAEYVIKQFGKAIRLAEAVGIGDDAIWHWKESGRIPSKHFEKILAIARKRKLDITPNDLVVGR